MATLNAGYIAVDNTETITYTSAAVSGAAAASHTVAFACRSEINRDEVAASGGYFTGQESVWEFPELNLNDGNTACKEGDRILGADGVAWRVLMANLIEWDATWHCVVVRER